MKFLTLLSLFLVLAARADTPKSTLLFNDETRITGTPILANGKEKSLKLTSPSLDGEITIETKGLREIDLGGDYEAPEADHYALATITKRYIDGPPLDSIRGRLLHLDDDSITLETAYAGTLKLRRSMVQALDIYSQSPSFYSGPHGPEGWVSSGDEIEESWTFTNRTMASKGSSGVARQIEIPERATIRFTAAWKSSPQFRILFLWNDGETDFPGVGYSLDVRTSYLTLNRTFKDQQSNLFGESMNALRNNKDGEAEFTIYFDRSKEGSSAVYIGKERVGTWTGTDDTEGMGNWIHFAPLQSRPIKFSKISISQWDGILPKTAEEQGVDREGESGEEASGPQLKLSNGDIVVGKITKIEDEFVLATTSFGDVQIPLNRMSSIDLKGETRLEEPRMWGEDIRAWFHEGGSITIRLDSMENGKIKGSSQVFGEAEFDLAAFSRLEFNIWRRELDPELYKVTDSW